MPKIQYSYGLQEDKVHPFFEKKREWSKVKDKILSDYITCYLKTIHRRGRPIIIVDAFSGPGRFGDGSDGSPVIVCREIESAPKRGVGIACIFSDSHKAHRTALQRNLSKYIESGVAGNPLSEFSEALSYALEVGESSTLFFYLDPYGIRDLDFETVRQIYERDPSQSTEVLINFNFKTFMRMSGNWMYSDPASTIAGKVKKAKVETLNSVMGGNYWLDLVTDPGLDKLQREDAVVNSYMDRLRKYFPFTFSIPVKEAEDSVGVVPSDELARYHLIFGTRSPKAVVYMNDVSLNALEPYLKQFKDGLLFDFTPSRYLPASTDEVKAKIIKTVEVRPMTRPEIYETIIPDFFLQRRTKEYRAVIDILAFKENRLYPDRKAMKRKNQLNDEVLLSTKPWVGDDGQ